MTPLHVTFPCPITILLLRHAERAATPANDPPLTPAGVQRALALVDAARGAGVSAIFTTQFVRTVQTAQPLAQNLGITPTVLAVAPATPGPYVEELVSQIRGMPPRTTALVVSHTTTIPMIGAALGAPAIAPIADHEFDKLFIIQVTSRGSKARLVRARYGPPSAAPQGAP